MNFETLSFLANAILSISACGIVCPALIAGYSMALEDEGLKLKHVCAILLTIGCFICGVIMTQSKYDIIDNKIEEGYIVYFNGTEIDANTVSFGNYNVSINDEAKTICLSEKKEAKKMYVPVIVR